MNRKNLTAAVLAGLAGAAGIAGTAQAVNLNPDGLGQVLLYPYYTSNDGNLTLLSVVNTTESGKAVKVRFKEGFNSREVLDFNLYLSAFDVWAAAIEDKAGTPTLFIPDSSCTVPYLFADGGEQAFLPFDYTGKNADGGPAGIDRAAEGHFEIIEMGTLTNDSETKKRLGTADAASHVIDADGVQAPADCEQLVDNWTQNPDGMWIDDETIDIARNSGGLFGGAAIINVARGTMYSYEARAIQGFDKAEEGVHLHSVPGTSSPSLNSGDQSQATVFFGVPQDKAVDIFYPRGVDAISATFMHEFTMNEYNIEAGLNAASEWVITFPTKNFYVDRATIGEVFEDIWVPNQNDPDCDFWSPGDDFPTRSGPDPEEDDGFGGSFDLCSFVLAEDVDLTEARPPFTTLFDGEACEKFGIEIWDREENSFENSNNKIPPIVSPAPPGGGGSSSTPEICYEVNVLRFGNDDVFNPVFGTTSALLKTVDTGSVVFDNGTKSKPRVAGWAKIDWDVSSKKAERHVDFAGLVGLPVTGFWAEQFENGFLGTPAASVLANYGGLFDHKGSVRSQEPLSSND